MKRFFLFFGICTIKNLIQSENIISWLGKSYLSCVTLFPFFNFCKIFSIDQKNLILDTQYSISFSHAFSLIVHSLSPSLKNVFSWDHFPEKLFRWNYFLTKNILRWNKQSRRTNHKNVGLKWFWTFDLFVLQTLDLISAERFLLLYIYIYCRRRSIVMRVVQAGARTIQIGIRILTGTSRMGLKCPLTCTMCSSHYIGFGSK